MKLYVYGSFFGYWHKRHDCGRSVLEVVIEPETVPSSLRCPKCWAPVPKEQLPLEEGNPA